jgi:hypothetical protein
LIYQRNTTSAAPLFETEVIHYDSWYHTQELVYRISFFPQAIRLWNQLPGSVMEADTPYSFKAQLSRAILI